MTLAAVSSRKQTSVSRKVEFAGTLQQVQLHGADVVCGAKGDAQRHHQIIERGETSRESQCVAGRHRTLSPPGEGSIAVARMAGDGQSHAPCVATRAGVGEVGRQANAGHEDLGMYPKGRWMPPPVFSPCVAGAGGVWYLRVDPKDKRIKP